MMIRTLSLITFVAGMLCVLASGHYWIAGGALLLTLSQTLETSAYYVPKKKPGSSWKELEDYDFEEEEG